MAEFLKIIYRNYFFSITLFYLLYIDNANSAEPWMDKWSHSITLQCITVSTPNDTKSSNTSVEKSNLRIENDLEVSQTAGLGKLSMSKRSCRSCECSFDQIKKCKKQCPRAHPHCIHICFKDDCKFCNFCECSINQIKHCENECEIKRCKEHAFCLESCFKATC